MYYVRSDRADFPILGRFPSQAEAYEFVRQLHDGGHQGEVSLTGAATPEADLQLEANNIRSYLSRRYPPWEIPHLLQVLNLLKTEYPWPHADLVQAAEAAIIGHINQWPLDRLHTSS